jgi:benzoyl-CoA reductase/2-hydroxyglutaryl-CoA dehydratase subunit BcrC/BadD/HgdB
MTMNVDIPTRSETIAQWRHRGGKVAALFPVYYPRELFRARGVLPVEVWGPPNVDASQAEARLQPYTCAIVRKGLAFATSSALEVVDLVVVPHNCDSLQGLGSVLRDFGGAPVPVLTFYVPRANRSCDLHFLTQELRQLDRSLADLGVEAAPGAGDLAQAIEGEVAADRALADLRRQRHRLPWSDLDFYRLVRSREYLPAERFVQLARTSVGAIDGDGGPSGVRLLLSGIVPEPMELFQVLNSQGATVVADDLACCGRRRPVAGLREDPLERTAERLLSGPPCPMRGSPLSERVRHLVQQVREAAVQGVIFFPVKFCEPEAFDLPALRQALDQERVPSLVVEGEVSDGLSQQTMTRLEAFVEMLR